MKTSKLSVGTRVMGALLVVQVVLTSPAGALVTSGEVITIAGSGSSAFSGDGGAATSAAIGNPYGTAIGPDGALYFVDAQRHPDPPHRSGHRHHRDDRGHRSAAGRLSG